MARYSDRHKEAVREDILHHAAARFRRDGIAGVGVRALMADVGLTHGGFYAHFRSREDLVAAALGHAAGATVKRFHDAARAAPEDRVLEAIVATYLHLAHRDHMEAGCAASALAPEIARETPATRRHFADRNRAFVTLLATHLPAGGSEEERHARATIIFATMMGVLQLMRIETEDEAIAALERAGRAAALRLASEPWPG